MRKRSVSSSSSMLNGFCNTLDRISRDHGGVKDVSEEEKRVNRGKMNLISKIVTPILLLSLCYFLFISESTILNVLAFVGIAMSTLWLPITAGLERRVNYVVGFLLFVNWFVFWMTPIVVQGAVFKLGLHEKVLKPIYDVLDTSKTVRKFASTYIYKKEKYADFFATQAYFVLGAIVSLGAMMYVVFERVHSNVTNTQLALRARSQVQRVHQRQASCGKVDARYCGGDSKRGSRKSEKEGKIQERNERCDGDEKTGS